jgi:1,4-alpha-glucan branching enzyme
MMYAFSEKFVLPLTHDEVARGKGSLISKIPGDHWQKFATIRLLLAYMLAQPGKKLLFMGTELAQWAEWDHDAQLDWALLDVGFHSQLRLLIGQLNFLYRSTRALWENEFSPSAFEWIEANDAEQNILSFIRRGSSPSETVVAVCNFSPVPRQNYRIGAPSGGLWTEILNTDASEYGGSGRGNFGGVEAVPIPLQNRTHSLTLVVPPLALVIFRRQV